MAKGKFGGASAEITVEFRRTGNAWVDAGIVGLHRVLNGLPAYADEVSIEPDAPKLRDGRHVQLLADRLVVSGPSGQVQASLEVAYDRLIATYYNVSSRKQKEDRGSRNFFYDSATDDFVTFFKKKAIGAASLLFDKAARPSGSREAWAAGPDGRREPGRLGPSHAHLQGRLDAFLAAEGLKPGPPAGLLIDGPNQVRPKVEIRVGAAEARGACFLSGEPLDGPIEAKETAFPLLGGSRSFVNGATNWPRLGWKADFVGKFVPAVAFFYLQGDDLHLFFPQSNDLRRVDEIASALRPMMNLEANLFRNIDFAPKLGGYFQKRSEVTFAFLHRVFVELSLQSRAVSASTPGPEPATPGEVWEIGDPPEPEAPGLPEQAGIEPRISAEDVIVATQQGGPVGFAVVSATKKGNVWMARDFWTFGDVVYLARLFESMQVAEESTRGVYRPRCSPSALMHALRDNEARAEAKTLVRDRVCEAILNRRPVLHLLERHAFHVNTGVAASASKGVWPLLRFAKLYEIELRKGTEMDADGGYQTMVNAATWLGKTIGKAIAGAVNDKSGAESRGRARGALFRLRKARTPADFMNELARLQFRYTISVPQDALDGQVFHPESFEDFRGFCVVAALNQFLYDTGDFAERNRRPQPSTNPGK